MTAAAEIAARLPCWRSEVTPEPLDGGITNANFTVTDRGQKFVVRIGEDIAVHQISRAMELASARAAHAAGLSPEVVHASPGALVIRWIEGRTLTAGDVRDSRTLQRCVRLIKRCHRDLPGYFRGPAPMFWVFQVLRDYGHTLAEGDGRHRDALPDYVAAARTLEQAAVPVDIVFGHNDLLPANLVDDGHRLWLIDWEYAGFNSPLFDLGGLASNSGLDPDQESWLLDTYFEGDSGDDLRRRYQAMKCASLLRESLWSMVQELYATLDVDYAAYTDDNLARFQRAWTAFQHA